MVMFLGLIIQGVLVSRLEYADRMDMLFLHIPVAWMSLLIYVVLGVCSFGYLVSKNPRLVIVGYQLTEIGIVFTVLTLITGSFWGRMTWGVYWAWDSRLIFVVVLLVFYCMSHEMYKKGGREGSVISIVGLVNLPLIKFGVNWWASLHQSSSFSFREGLVHEVMFYPMLVWFSIFLVFSIWWLVVGMRRVKIGGLLLSMVNDEAVIR
jgi:heme exporter protein C